MRLRCAACGCYVKGYYYSFPGWDGKAYKWPAAYKVQPCKRCLRAARSDGYRVTAMMLGFRK